MIEWLAAGASAEGRDADPLDELKTSNIVEITEYLY
jgi:hypothetical protein